MNLSPRQLAYLRRLTDHRFRVAMMVRYIWFALCFWVAMSLFGS